MTQNAWQSNCRELAAWAWERLAIKQDRHGQYSAKGRAAWSSTPVTKDRLAAHFAGADTIGLGATSLDDQCIWVAWDLDNHVSDVATSVNLKFAIVLRDRLFAMGFRTIIIEDSDDKGGIHVWLLFSSPIPAAIAHHFAKLIARDFAEHGLEKVECFPKNTTVLKSPMKCGHYLRIPGKHHKRDHWSRFYGSGDWLSQADSVQLLLSQTGDDPALIPPLPEEPQHAAEPLCGNQEEVLARQALGSISPDNGYDDWLKIGQALHFSGDHMLPLWIEWSRASIDFDEAECRSKWKTYHRNPGGVTLGTLFHMAEQNGWQHPQRQSVHQTVVKDGSASAAVEMTLDEKTVNDQVIAALAKRGDIYDHGGSLAVIVDEHVDGEEPRKTIRHLSLPTLREIIAESCRFFTWKVGTRTGDPSAEWKRVPRWCFEAVLARGSWPGIRPIRGVVTSPVLRADGSILQSAGYDDASGLYVDLTEDFPTIPSDPSAEAVKDAVAMLFDLVRDFPFKDSASQSAWLASLLTPLAREAYKGCTGPLFLFDANVRGSGKSLLADINSLIVTGREATRMTAPQSDDEARKRITALVKDSDRIVLIDNIAGRFGCPSLDAALTGTIWKDRLLQFTEMIEAPLRMTWYGSGNNVILEADTARRVCHVRLESPLENPEDREGFKYPDIRKHVRKHRPALLTAALTILRGYIAAKRPDQKLKPWGSFEGWGDLVRATIVSCGMADPGETRTELRATSDSEAGALRQMLLAVAHVDPNQHGLRTSDMLRLANNSAGVCGTDIATLRDAIETVCGRAIEKVNSQQLGNRLSHFRNRVVDQSAFDCRVKSGSNYWFVQSGGGPVVPGGPDLDNP
jgi:hypothetical protein